MHKLTLFIAGFVFVSFTDLLAVKAWASDKEFHNRFEYSSQIYEIETKGIRQYKNQDYKNAYKNLSFSARQGLKNSQHFLGVMYLKGQFAPKSLKLGMGWLGVANEIEIDEWTKLYTKIYAQLNDAQKVQVDGQVAEFRSLYGVDSQGINCEKQTTLSRRKARPQCYKSEEQIFWFERK